MQTIKIVQSNFFSVFTWEKFKKTRTTCFASFSQPLNDLREESILSRPLLCYLTTSPFLTLTLSLLSGQLGKCEVVNLVMRTTSNSSRLTSNEMLVWLELYVALILSLLVLACRTKSSPSWPSEVWEGGKRDWSQHQRLQNENEWT